MSCFEGVLLYRDAHSYAFGILGSHIDEHHRVDVKTRCAFTYGGELVHRTPRPMEKASFEVMAVRVQPCIIAPLRHR